MTYAYDIWLLLLCIWREARGEPEQCWRGIWWVLHNRVGRSGFRPTLIRCILQPGAIDSMTKQGDANLTAYPNDFAVTSADWQAWLQIQQIAQDPGTDQTDGAVYYEAVDPADLPALRARAPWFAEDKMTCQFGKTRFYRA